MTPMFVQRVWHRIRFATAESSEPDAGFTLVEVLVALTVFVIVSVAAVSGLVALIQGSSQTRSRITATDLAQQDLAQQRGLADRTQVAATPTSHGTPVPVTKTVGDRTFHLVRTVSGVCSSNHAKDYSPAFVDVTTTVSWNGGGTPVTTSTRLAC